jgi:hypothetical protein
MPKLLADLFVSVDGRTSGTRSPGYFGPDLDRWIHIGSRSLVPP